MEPLGPQLTDARAMAQVMGIEDKAEPLLFEAAQVSRSLTTPDSIRAVFEKSQCVRWRGGIRNTEAYNR